MKYELQPVIILIRLLFQRLLPSATFISALMSCEMVVDVDLPEEPPRLAVKYVSAVDAPYRSAIALTQSQPAIINTEAQRVTDAKITIHEEGDCIMLREISSDV